MTVFSFSFFLPWVLVSVELEPDPHQNNPNQTKPNQNQIKPSKSFKNRSKQAAKLKLSAAGEDLVPEPPLQAQATGEGEGNDWDTGRGRIVATEVRNNSSRAGCFGCLKFQKIDTIVYTGLQCLYWSRMGSPVLALSPRMRTQVRWDLNLLILI